MNQSVNVSRVPRHSKIPVKHMLSLMSVRELYGQIMNQTDFTQMKSALIVHGKATNQEEADELVKAWVQWLCVGATTNTKSYLMFHGPVDDAFHAAILCTRWYADFCKTHIGCFVHHDPVPPESVNDTEITAAIRGTLMLLSNKWGDDLHPQLSAWVQAEHTGSLQPSSVSCVGNGYPD